ncbi:MAG: hypothetical protein Q4B50_02330 [Bacillota bacterium]|nr:hypothetical protein [Bacillota bacterium]
MVKQIEPIWMKLDNAAKIYPAAMRRDWTAIFRFSMNLTEKVDPQILARALHATMPRFPSFSVRLRRGMFWFYLDHNPGEPELQEDVANPCVRMKLRENRHFMFRVRYYDTRIAVEFFHVLCDGSGGLCFIKTLVAEYLRLKYGAKIPRGAEILNCKETPKEEEWEDAFLRYAGRQTRSRQEPDAYFLPGASEPPDGIHVVTGIIPVKEVLSRAKAMGVTLTEFLTAVLIQSVDSIQRKNVRREGHLKPVKVCIPVNLRAIFPSSTLRNFSFFVNPGVEARLGEYSLEEIAAIVHHQMGLEVTEKNLRARFSVNVRSEQNPILRVTPLFLKNLVMRAVFYRVGDRKTSTTLTNLGRVQLPPEMSKYVQRMDLVLGPLSRNRAVSAAISYQDTLYYTFTNTMKSRELEREFFHRLVKLGIPVKVESNQQWS